MNHIFARLTCYLSKNYFSCLYESACPSASTLSICVSLLTSASIQSGDHLPPPPPPPPPPPHYLPLLTITRLGRLSTVFPCRINPFIKKTSIRHISSLDLKISHCKRVPNSPPMLGYMVTFLSVSPVFFYKSLRQT